MLDGSNLLRALKSKYQEKFRASHQKKKYSSSLENDKLRAFGGSGEDFIPQVHNTMVDWKFATQRWFSYLRWPYGQRRENDEKVYALWRVVI